MSVDTLFSPQELFLAWEREPWSSQEVDLTADASAWPRLKPRERDAVLWALSSLHQLLPAVARALEPSTRNGRQAFEVAPTEVREFALAGLNRRLNVIGVEL